jgi:DNA-binding NarL/FixJ family response regulator
MGSQLMASALKRYRSQFEVVGLAGKTTEAINQLQTQNPNVAVVSPELQDGMKNREIARELHSTEHRIFERLGVSGRVELTFYTASRRSQT